MKKGRGRVGSVSEALLLETGGIVSLVGAGGKTTLLFRLAQELALEGQRVLVTTTTHMCRPNPGQVAAVLLSPDPEEILEEARALGGMPGALYAASHEEGEEGKLVGLSPERVERIWDGGAFGWILVEADGAARRPLKAPASHEPVIPKRSRWVVGLVGLDALGRPLGDTWVFRWKEYGRLCGLEAGEAVTAKSVARLALHPQGLFKGAPREALRVLWLNKADLPGRAEEAKRVARAIMQDGWGDLRRIVAGCAQGERPVFWCFDSEAARGLRHEGPVSRDSSTPGQG